MGNTPSLKWQARVRSVFMVQWSVWPGHFLFTLSPRYSGNVTIGDVRHGKWKRERTNTSSWWNFDDPWSHIQRTGYGNMRWRCDSPGKIFHCFAKYIELFEFNFEQIFILASFKRVLRVTCTSANRSSISWASFLLSVEILQLMEVGRLCQQSIQHILNPNISTFWIRNAQPRLQNPNQQTMD